MSIKKKLNETFGKIQTNTITTKSVLKEIFGEDFEEYTVNDYEYVDLILFEEDKKYYKVSIEIYHNGTDEVEVKCQKFYELNPVYSALTDHDLDVFLHRKKIYERDLKTFEKIFSHPSYRLKKLFKERE